MDEVATTGWDVRPPRVEQQLARLGLPNPYFGVHDGASGPHVSVDGVPMLSFSGYDYLGLACDPDVIAAAKAAIDRYGTSASASRVVSGERPVHGALEAALAAHLGCEAALVLVSGHATNVGVLGHLLGPRDLVVLDADAHNSLVLGARLSGAARRTFPHNDIEALDSLLTDVRHRYRRVLVVVESVYSMDGDQVDLPALIALRQRHGVLLYVDEAHSVGVLGPRGAGAADHWGIDPSDVDIWMGTLSKALAGCGGYIAGSRALVDSLRHTAPGFVYSVGMPPSVAAGSLAALQRLRDKPELAATARARGNLFRELAAKSGLDTGLSAEDSPIVPIVVGEDAAALRLAHRLRCRGIEVHPFTPPSVSEGQARLRFFLTVRHTEQDIRRAIALLQQETSR